MIDSETEGLLARLYEERTDFARVFDYLASRKRNWNELVVDRLVEESSLDELGATSSRRKVIIEFFRRLESMGAGKLIVGRGRRKTRFHWVRQLTMLEAAAAARAGKAPVPAETQGRSETVQAEGLELLPHQFALRPDFVVRFQLPTDLTSLEADRLSAFIQALPFEGRKGEQS